MNLPGAIDLHRRRLLRAGGAAALAAVMLLLGSDAQAQSINVQSLEVSRVDGALMLDFSARLSIAGAVEEALVRGVPVHFVAEATVRRPRWYWRDERVARASRTWRLSFQPLTTNWRVTMGGLSQSYATAEEALQTISRISQWRVAEASRLDADTRYIVEFSYRLDTTQLPRPMQLGLGTLTEWQMEFEKSIATP